MNSRSNRRCLAGLILAWSIFLPACNQDPQTRKQKFYDNGMNYLKKGDHRKAGLQFMNALQIDPKFAEAANVLAEIRFREHDYRQAYALLQQVVATKPDYLPARRGLAQIYRLSGKLPEAQKELEFILEHSPDDLETLMNLGSVLARLGRANDAEGMFNRVLELQPNQVGALNSLAALKRDAGDLADAERYYRLAIEKNPRSVPGHLGLIAFYITAGRAAEAEPLFAQALRMSKDNPAVLDAQAGYYEGLKKYPEAEAVVKKIHFSQAGNPDYWTVLAGFYARIGEWAKAKDELERVLQQHKDDRGALHKLIEINLTLNDRQSAERLNEALLKKNPKDSYGLVFKGRLDLQSGQIQKAMQEFYDAETNDPTLPAVHYWLAQAHIQKGELLSAKEELTKALAADPNSLNARVSLAKVQNATGAVDNAMANARKALANNPQDVEAMLVYGESLVRKNDYATAKKIVSIVLARDPRNSEGHRLSGILFLTEKNVPAARREFEAAWNLQPNSRPLLDGVVLGYFVAKQPDAAVDFLQARIQQRPGDALLYQELGHVYLWQHKRAAAISAFEKALTLAPASPEVSVLLADTYTADNQADRAGQLLAASMQKNPADGDLAYRSGMIFEKMGHWDEARKAYERELQIDSGNALAKNNLAWLLAEHGGNVDVALKLAQEAKEKLNDNLQVTNTIGWIYFKKGIYKTARDYLKQCADADQNNASFQYQLGMAELKLGNQPQAREALRKTLSLDPKFPEAALLRASLAEL